MRLSLITVPAVEPITIAEAKRQLLLGTSAGEPAPTAPSVALASPAAPGNCDTGDWRVGLTFVTPDGETELGELSDAVTVASPAVNGQITVTDVALGGASVTARNVYAVAPGQSTAKYAGTIANNTDDSYTLNIAAASLGVTAPSTNTTEDPEIRDLIVAARERGEGATGRQFIEATWEGWLPGFPRYRGLELPKPPLVSVSSVTYIDANGDEQTFDASNYHVITPAGPRCERGRIDLVEGVSWPTTLLSRRDAVKVRFVAGYGTAGADVPALLRSAMKMHIKNLYDNRGGGGIDDTIREIYWSFRSHPTQPVPEGTV